MKKVFTIFWLMFSTSLFAQVLNQNITGNNVPILPTKINTTITIAEALIDVDSNFVPDRTGETVTVSGIVSSKNFQSTSTYIFIQDNTAGVLLWCSQQTRSDLNVGDEILVTGTVIQYKGLNEIQLSNIYNDISFISHNNQLPFIELTINELLENAEFYEGKLVKLNQVTKTIDSAEWPEPGASRNLTITDISGSELTLRIDSDTNIDDNKEPIWPINVIGILAQFTYKIPADDGYQLWPRFYSDIESFLTRPDGGEEFYEGSLEEIKWIQPTGVIVVKLEYSIDNGSNWNIIISTTENDGHYNWKIPERASRECLVKITNVSDSNTYDLSSNSFTIRANPISPTVVINPTDANVFEGEHVNFILEDYCFDEINYQWWQISPDGFGNIKLNNIESKVNGVNTNTLTIMQPSILDSAKQFFCELSNSLDPLNLITISDTVELHVNKTLFITNEMNSQIWNVGSSYRISWNSLFNIGNIKLEYSIDGGNGWTQITELNSIEQHFDWVIPNSSSEECKIKITSLSNSDITDITDGHFTIFLPQTISVNIEAESYWYDDNFNGSEFGELNGSSSNINYGQISSYLWFLNGDTIAVGSNPTVELSSGTHKIFLEVLTQEGNTGRDSIVINVYAKHFNTESINYSSISSLDESSFFINSTNNDIYNFDSTGTEVWTLSTEGSIVNTPCIQNEDLIFSGSGNRLYCYTNIGVPNWDKSLGSNITSTPSIGSNNKVCVGLENGRLYIINEDGDILNSVQTGGAIISSAAITDDAKIYFGSSDKNIYEVSFDGTILNSFTTGDSVISSPALGNDSSIVIGSNDGYLYKLNRELELLWKYQTSDKIKSSPVIDRDGNIYFGSNNGKIYALSKDGILLWSYKSNSPVNSDPTIDKDGNIYVGNNAGELLVLNNNGLLQWYFQTGSEITESILLTKNNIIYQSVTDGHTYILKVPEEFVSDSTFTKAHQWSTFKGNNQRSGYVWDGVTDINNVGNVMPTKYMLSQNFPNPFNPSTVINYSIIKPSQVTLKLYNVLGKEILELVNKEQSIGNYKVSIYASKLTSGIYFYRLQAGDFIETKKMILLK